LTKIADLKISLAIDTNAPPSRYMTLQIWPSNHRFIKRTHHITYLLRLHTKTSHTANMNTLAIKTKRMKILFVFMT